jgi:hypothetical protein
MSDQPKMTCPKCGKEYDDFDGVGVVRCEACGYCQHVSMSAQQGREAWRSVCDACKAVLPSQAPVQADKAGLVPWEIHVRAWQVYAALHGDQSALRIAERGGFGWQELALLLAERNPFSGEARHLLGHQRERLRLLREAKAEKL